jgi:hypothetical protein
VLHKILSALLLFLWVQLMKALALPSFLSIRSHPRLLFRSQFSTLLRSTVSPRHHGCWPSFVAHKICPGCGLFLSPGMWRSEANSSRRLGRSTEQRPLSTAGTSSSIYFVGSKVYTAASRHDGADPNKSLKWTGQKPGARPLLRHVGNNALG